MSYRLLADAVVVLHLGYVVFTVGGQALVLTGAALKWRWIRNRAFRIVHLAAVGLVAVEAVVGVFCPLTVWEYRLRELAGDVAAERAGFVARIIHALIYYDLPGWFFLALYVGYAAVVFATFVAIPPARRVPALPARCAPPDEAQAPSRSRSACSRKGG